MKFTVKTLPQADRDYCEILEFLAHRSTIGASAWARAFDKALARLEASADTLPLAPENDQVKLELREILFKTRKGHFYRAIFTIRDDEAFVLHVRGPGQDLLSHEDLGPSSAK